MYRCIAFLCLGLATAAFAQSDGPRNALAFNGTDGFVAALHQPALDAYPITVTAWVKTTQTDGSAGLINKYASGAFSGWQVYLVNGQVRAWYFADSANYVWDGGDGLNGGLVADGLWHHLAFTVDAGGGKLYVDGILRAARPWTGNPGPTSTRRDLTLGDYPGVAPNYFQGELDEVTVWNISLSPAQIQESRHHLFTGTETGLVVCYDFDEAEQGIAFDSAPAGGDNHGVVSGGAIRVPSTAPLWPSQPTGTIRDVQHVVVFMQENRSFDHYFGSLRGVRGFDDRNALVFQNGDTVFSQPRGDGFVLPFPVADPCVDDLAHNWSDAHDAWNGGNWDQWIPAKGAATMAYYTRDNLPFHYALADAYTICDAYHCSIMASSNPNRLYLWTGMVDPRGTGGGPIIDNGEPFPGFTWTTYPERLQQAGVSWKVYQEPDNFDDNPLFWFAQYRFALPGNPLRDRGVSYVGDLVSAFQSDVANGTLPRVSWIIAPTLYSEHPPYSPDSGAALTKRLLDALASNRDVFNSTVFILTYDENDGYFDHVPAPVPFPRTPDEFVNGTPIGLGSRVPTILVSPWTRGGRVCSQVFDHTSILRFLERWTGVAESNISQWRRQVCGDLTLAFDFEHPDYSYPNLPDVDDVFCLFGVNPTFPAVQSFPLQEAGTRPARPLPYRPNAVSAVDCANGILDVVTTNAGAASVHFAIYPNAYRTDHPVQLDVPAGGSKRFSFDVVRYGGGYYDLTCYGPNGFQRRFAGNINQDCGQIEASTGLDPTGEGVPLTLQNGTAAEVLFLVQDNLDPAGEPSTYAVPAQSDLVLTYPVPPGRAGWYDFTATVSSDPLFLRRCAGHLEGGPPVIATQPAGTSVEAGLGASFVVTAENGPLTYQWQFNGVDVPEATGSAYTLTDVSPANDGLYDVVVSNPQGSVRSLSARLTVFGAPELLSQPSGETVDAGAGVSFAPVTVGGHPLLHRWYRDGELVSTSVASGLTLNRVRPADAGDYQLVASNAYGAVTSAVARLNVQAGALTDGLVVHLSFDGHLQDLSGRGNDAAYVFNGDRGNPTPTFVSGLIGQAFQYTTRSDGSQFEYATLGYPDDLRFGESDGFSISMWVNYANQSGDLPFLSNKDWDKSHHPGWSLATQRGGNFRFNATGPNEGADFFTSARTPIIRDGTWHHVLVAVQRAVPPRAAFVYLYLDGVLVDKTRAILDGPVDTFDLPFSYASPGSTKQTAWAVNIGQDGTGVYYDKGGAYAIGAKIDDLGIWRRALTANAARAIYAAGLEGKDLSQATIPPYLSYSMAQGELRLTWTGAPTARLQKSVSLNPAVWIDVPGAVGPGSTTVPLNANQAYFRVVP
jgi:phospholipase C